MISLTVVNLVLLPLVIDALEDNFALCFNQKKWYDQIKKYNISILSRDRS